MQRTIHVFAILISMSIAAVVGACAVDEEVAESPAELAGSCSVLLSCNAPGGAGAKCRQQPGCSVGAAALECELETVLTCGHAVCPVILVKLDGTKKDLCNQDLP